MDLQAWIGTGGCEMGLEGVNVEPRFWIGTQGCGLGLWGMDPDLLA